MHEIFNIKKYFLNKRCKKEGTTQLKLRAGLFKEKGKEKRKKSVLPLNCDLWKNLLLIPYQSVELYLLLDQWRSYLHQERL